MNATTTAVQRVRRERCERPCPPPRKPLPVKPEPAVVRIARAWRRHHGQ